MVSHFGSWKKKNGIGFGCVLLNRGLHAGAGLWKENSICSRVSSPGHHCSSLFDSLFVTPKHLALAPAGRCAWGCQKAVVPMGKGAAALHEN